VKVKLNVYISWKKVADTRNAPVVLSPDLVDARAVLLVFCASGITHLSSQDISFRHEHSTILLSSTLKMEAACTSETSEILSICTWCKHPRSESISSVNNSETLKPVIAHF
jgi:hypothetical protein